jgi:hypothetical protein
MSGFSSSRLADFVFGDAGLVSCAEMSLAGQPLASHVQNIANTRDGVGITRGTAAAYLTLSARSDINVLADVQGKIVGIYDNGNGAFQ